MLNSSMLLTAALGFAIATASSAAQDAAPTSPLDAAPPGVVMHDTLLALPADLHQELAAVLPAELGAQDPTGFSPQRWLSSMRSLAIGLRLPPRAEVELRMQCHSAEAAVACEQELAKLLPLLPPPIPQPSLSVDGDSVVVKLVPEKIQEMLATAVAPARANAYRLQAMNNAKQLALAMHNFHDAYQFFPGKYTADQVGVSGFW